MSQASPLKRAEIIDALRDGAVPRHGLELFAVGLERFEAVVDEVEKGGPADGKLM